MGNTQSSGVGVGNHGQPRSQGITGRATEGSAAVQNEYVASENTTHGSRLALSSASTSRYSGIYDSIRRRSHQARSTQRSHSVEEDTVDVTRPQDDGGASETMETAASSSQPPFARLERSASTISRVGSMLLPGSFGRTSFRRYGDTSINEGNEGPQVAGREETNRQDSVVQPPADDNSRFSLNSVFRRRTIGREGIRRHIRGPFPIGHVESPMLETEAGYHADSHNSFARGDDAVEAPRGRRTRTGRIRHSLHLPLMGLFGNSVGREYSDLPRSPTPHPGQSSHHDDSTSFSSSQHGSRHGMEQVAHELDAVESETRHVSSTSRITSGMTSIRRFPHGLRSRSTRLIRRGEHPPLSQVLQLAAAAIAAQLSGNGASGINGPRPVTGETFDGSIQNFVQTLQDAASAQAGENIDLNASDGDLPPVNFMRVFQFPNDENGTPIAPLTTNDAARPTAESSLGNDHDRSVTLVLVGVRSMPNIQDGAPNEGGTIGPSLDTLLSLPFLPPANVLRNGSSGALFRRSDTRSRGSRRHSMTNFNFASQRDGQRHSRARTGSRTSSADQSLLNPTTPPPLTTSETPPGPHPPPSTPADVRSGQATPVRRPSSASAAQASLLPHPEEDNQRADRPPVTAAEPSLSTPRQRRRSDSEFARRPELGSGALRRNGVVEPDRPPVGGGRSWLIYVVGTNVSPDHPAFTMPSLFTDNPSYEDMQMLSTLLGPVKPPVATQDDVNSAGGTYRLILQDGVLIATAAGSELHHAVVMAEGDRCLICLSDYAAEEEVRQLGTCNHIFHRECIDEWLTTGRNSCPMCRGQGVTEHSSAAAPNSQQAT